MIACKRVAKAFGKKKVLTDVSFQVHPKECVCIVGKSGSGKTMLMKLLLRAEVPSSGTIEVDGVALSSLPVPILQMLRRRIGPLFREPIEIASMTVMENACFAAETKGTLSPQAERRVVELLKKLGLGETWNAYPHTLSLGERCLLGLARALIGKPMIIIADEPLAHLDEAQAELALALLLEAHKQGVTLVVFTRDSSLADRLPGRKLMLQNGVIKAAEGAAPRGHEATHRILEHEEPSDHETPLITPGGRKIKITAIGSNVQ